jgi:uncharacterized protein YlzI (FlbEa/FlbD family)
MLKITHKVGELRVLYNGIQYNVDLEFPNFYRIHLRSGRKMIVKKKFAKVIDR